MKNRVLIAMSGGVDSSLAAAILKEKGLDVVGTIMQIWDYSQDEEARFGTCCSLDDISEARRVADSIGIPFYVLNLENEFEKEVIHYFVEEYKRGRTPNPCIYCNNKLKFNYLLNYAESIGASQVATGHYASIINEDGRYFVKKGEDPLKDQSYYLFDLTQSQLKKAYFPLGSLTKKEVREEAKKIGLRVADKEESQEICFIPDNNYSGFVAKRIGSEAIAPGAIVTEDGKVIGKHDGIHKYTVGQRKGLGVAWTSPLYVQRIDVSTNRIVVTGVEGLLTKRFFIENLTWSIRPETLTPGYKTDIKIRSRHTPAEAFITVDKQGCVEAEFTEPQSAVAPGQAAVFYKGNIIIGGGWIANS